MKVIAQAGIKVPKEEQPNSYITDSEAIDVPDTVYYQRRITDGDLLLAQEGDLYPVLLDSPAIDQMVNKLSTTEPLPVVADQVDPTPATTLTIVKNEGAE